MSSNLTASAKTMRVVVNGTFDVIHVGHLKLLEFARSNVNSYVLVLIDSDRRVKELKGPERPVNSAYERKLLLESLRFVDEVSIFDSDNDLCEQIRNYNPDIMVKGSDYRGKPILGAEYCKDIVYYERIEEYSSTKKIQHIASRR